MLFYGNGNYIVEEAIVYNLNSMKEGFPRFQYLIPPKELGKFIDRDFDIAYYNYLFGADIVFKEFFDIIYTLYTGQDVYILIDQKMDWSENIAESLFKVIQQRYGCNAIQINSFEDYIYINNYTEGSTFNPYFGLYNLDIDKERYTNIIERNKIYLEGYND